jgi:hypothetical protein
MIIYTYSGETAMKFFKVKNIAFYALLISLALPILSGCGGGKMDEGEYIQETSDTVLKQPRRMAIYPFNISGKTDLSAEGAMDLLISELIDLNGYEIVQREDMEKLLNEIGLGLSDLADESNRLRVSKLLLAKFFCFGVISGDTNILTARITHTETSLIVTSVSISNKDHVKGINELAEELKKKLNSPNVKKRMEKIDPSTSLTSTPTTPTIPVTTHEVKGYGEIVDGDFVTARELALKDAYARAIEQGCGVKLIRQTKVENFQLVRDSILTESVGYIKSYEVLNENPNSQYGYEISVKAEVSQEPISDLDQLRLMVRFLLAEPRIAIIMEGEIEGEEMGHSRASVVEGQIAAGLQKAGFLVVDSDTIRERKKEFAETLDDEEAARLGSILDADVMIRGSISSFVSTRLEEYDGKKLNLPMIIAKTAGNLKIILTDTARVISVLTHDDLKLDPGRANTEDAAVDASISNFIDASSVGLAWELAAKLGEPSDLRLELQNVSMTQAQQFQQQLQELPEHMVLDVRILYYGNNVVDYQVRTSIKGQVLAQKILDIVNPASFNADSLNIEEVKIGTITLSASD